MGVGLETMKFKNSKLHAETNALNIFSLNIELDRHFDRFIPFVNQQKPDVILLQEVLDKDIRHLEKELEMKSVFTPITFWSRDNNIYKLGMATFSSLPITKVQNMYYKGDPDLLPILKPSEAETIPRALLVTDIIKEDKHFCFVNTHFTWTPDGKPTIHQYKDLEILLDSLQKINAFVLCGDFNAPRGTPIFDVLASKYKDNIPSHITTTIDKNLHKAGDLNLMVDGLFSTPEYHIDSIEVVDGLSDHCGVLARVEKLK